MNCLSCSKNLEGCEHRKFQDHVFCMTCEVKFVHVTYEVSSCFMIPKNWEKDKDYIVKYDTIYHKSNGEFDTIELAIWSASDFDYKRPNHEIEVEDKEDYDSVEFFDCQ